MDMDFAAVVPEHFLNAVHVLHLLMGGNQLQEFCTPAEIFCKVNMMASCLGYDAVLIVITFWMGLAPPSPGSRKLLFGQQLFMN